MIPAAVSGGLGPGPLGAHDVRRHRPAHRCSHLEQPRRRRSSVRLAPHFHLAGPWMRFGRELLDAMRQQARGYTGEGVVEGLAVNSGDFGAERRRPVAMQPWQSRVVSRHGSHEQGSAGSDCFVARFPGMAKLCGHPGSDGGHFIPQTQSHCCGGGGAVNARTASVVRRISTAGPIAVHTVRETSVGLHGLLRDLAHDRVVGSRQ